MREDFQMQQKRSVENCDAPREDGESMGEVVNTGRTPPRQKGDFSHIKPTSQSVVCSWGHSQVEIGSQ